MNRRSKKCRGWVNFPVNSKKYKNSGEGGMFVRLVIVDNGEASSWTQCCGGYQNVVMDETYVGDDRHLAENVCDDKGLPVCSVGALLHFPWHLSTEYPDLSLAKYSSLEYLCALVIGSTGWSGYDKESKEYWLCKYNDLTEEGKELYGTFGELYPGREITLQTWLDT